MRSRITVGWCSTTIPTSWSTTSDALSCRRIASWARRCGLGRVADAARSLGVRLAIASGSTDASQLSDLSPDWLVRRYLPQVHLLGAATAAVTHGGNNSVTEAIGSGVPLLVLPFSTDQFAG